MRSKGSNGCLQFTFILLPKIRKRVHSVCAQVYSFMTLSTGDVRKLNKNDESGREI